jgi:RNA-directed DNA polymerase
MEVCPRKSGVFSEEKSHLETLHDEAYQAAKKNDGAPGIDGVAFDAIEEGGVESFLRQIKDELVSNTYRPMRVRKKEIPKDGGKVRILSIPSIRDRVVQGALKLVLEPIFEADFQSGSYGYRPKRTAHEAVNRVAHAIVEEKTRIIDIDLSAYFDNVQHSLLLEKVAQRIKGKRWFLTVLKQPISAAIGARSSHPSGEYR